MIYYCISLAREPALWPKQTAEVRTAAWQLRLYIIWFSNRRATAAVYMLTMWRNVRTAAWPLPEPQSEPQPEPHPDRSSLYINNDDVMQTASVRTAAVCLDHYVNIVRSTINAVTAHVCGTSIAPLIHSTNTFLKFRLLSSCIYLHRYLNPVVP